MEVCTVYKLYRIVIIQKIGDSFWLSSKSFLPVSDSQLLTLHTLKKICQIKKKTRPVIKIMVIPRIRGIKELICWRLASG